MPTINDLRIEGFLYQLDQPEPPPPYETILLIELNGDGTDVLEVRFPHNPESFDSEYSAKWMPRRAPGAVRDLSDFEGFDPATRSFEWLGETKDPERFESSLLLPLEGAMQLILDETQEAPRVLLLQGVHSMRGHLGSLRIRRVRTDARGYARVAEISLSITQNDDQL